MNTTREAVRYKISTPRECNFCIITFKDLAWQERKTLVVDISRHGAGIESKERLEPGFIWFLDRLGGFRSGVLMWTKRTDAAYRAGVRFLPLSPDEEKFIQGQVSLILDKKQPSNPDAVVAIIMEALTGMSSVPAAPQEAPGKKPDDDSPLDEIQDMASKL